MVPFSSWYRAPIGDIDVFSEIKITAIHHVCTGVYPGGCRPGGVKLKNGTLTPLRHPKVFFPGAPQGRPCLCLNGALFVMLIYLFLSFYLSFPLFFLFSLPFPFLFFGAPLVTRGPQCPPGCAPDIDVCHLNLLKNTHENMQSP